MESNSDLESLFPRNEEGLSPTDEGYAKWLDRNDPLASFRQEFCIPQKKTFKKSTKRHAEGEDDPCVFFTAFGIGLQPRCTAQLLQHFLDGWATQSHYAAFLPLEDSGVSSWIKMEGETASAMAKIVGAQPSETVLMGGLTTSLHLLMASFYRPDAQRRKIIVEKEAFSSDFFAVESQLKWHGLDVAENMILIESDPIIDQSRIFEALDKHGSSTAMLLLSGVQYVTGQLLDIPSITEYAHRKGVLVCWDLAHAVGNVELKLHEWDVDLAVWCTYKYLGCGPGTIGGTFVHEKHGKVDAAAGADGYRPRLAGWWGLHPVERFKMENNYLPEPGAAGFQVSNVPVMDLTAVLASLSVFEKTSMSALRQKSIKITGYLDYLLRTSFPSKPGNSAKESSGPFAMITPSAAAERGAQLSLKIRPDLEETIKSEMEKAHIIVDVRRGSIMRVAPSPLYNTYTEVWYFVDVLKKALKDKI